MFHLRGDTAPEVGVRPLRVQHGSDDGFVLSDQQVEGVGVGEDVVRVRVLRRREKRRGRGKEKQVVTQARTPPQTQEGQL